MDHISKKGAIKSMVLAMSLAGLAGWVQAGPVTDAMLAKDPGDSWLHANGNWGGHRTAPDPDQRRQRQGF